MMPLGKIPYSRNPIIFRAKNLTKEKINFLMFKKNKEIKKN